MQDTSKQFATLLFLIFGILSIFLHINSFYVPHNEGDEDVYMALAEEMNWDFTHYTTMDNPDIRNFPNDIYRKPLFHHPPLFPLILKIGSRIGNPVIWGLIFQNLVFMLFLSFLARICYRYHLSQLSSAVLFLLGTLCPILTFSMTKLHIDGLYSVFLFCGTSLLIEALETASAKKSLLSGVLLILAFNTNYAALITIPIFFSIQVLNLYRNDALTKQGGVFQWKNWECFFCTMVPLTIFGGVHYARILYEYGSLLPSVVVGKLNVDWNQFVTIVAGTTRLQAAIYLVLTLPLVVNILSCGVITTIRRMFRERKMECGYVFAFMYLVTTNFILPSSYQQLRYFAHLTPFLFVTNVFALERSAGKGRMLIGVIIGFSLLLMITTSFFNTIVHPSNARIVPSVILYLPFLRSYFS